MIRCLLVATVLAGLWTASTPASAQTAEPVSERPYRGVFRANRTSGLDATVTLFGSVDDDSTLRREGESPNVDPLLLLGRTNSNAVVGLAYTRTGPGLSLAVNVGSDVRYYPDSDAWIWLRRSGGVGVEFEPMTSLAVRLDQRVDDSPYLGLDLFPQLQALPLGGSTAANPDYAVSESRLLDAATSATGTWRLGRRSSLETRYRWRHTDLAREDQLLRSHTASADWTHQASRVTGFRAGYEIESATNIFPEFRQGFRSQQVRVGLDRTWVQSRTRRPQISLEAGPSIVEWYPDRRTTRLLGSAELTYPFGRTWTLRGAFERGTGIVGGLEDPFFSDGVTAGLTGLIHRRIDVAFTAAYAVGDVGEGERDAGGSFDSYSGTARMRWAATRTTAFFVEYLYYFYEFGNDVRLPNAFPNDLTRSTVRAGLTLWLPIFEQRQRNDPR